MNTGGVVVLAGGLVGLLVFIKPFDSITFVGSVGVAVAGGSVTEVVGVSVRMMPVDLTTVPMVEQLVHTIDDSPPYGGGDSPYGGGCAGVSDTVGGVGSAGASVVLGGFPGKRVTLIVESLTHDVEETGGD